MPLTSPRFASSNTLNRVAANAAKLDLGSTGRAVHLLQMALMDLGYALPLSTGNPNYSPDGIYGEETARVVKQFQKDCRTLAQDE
jgi:peptidoglycan hydrolase-like protein with peptidoglycan-binding domain